MKIKTLSVALTAVCTMFLSSGAAAAESAATTAEKVSVEPAKILIAYYSWGGNTRKAATEIQKLTGGTLFEIKPKTAYPRDYSQCVIIARQQKKAGVKPELESKVEDISKYDVIFVGSPNWWGTMAPPVATFLASYDLSGKTVIPFITHGGNGAQDFAADVRKMCPKSTVTAVGAFAGAGISKASESIAKFVSDVVAVKK